MTKDDGVLARVAALKTTPTPDLKAEWRKLFGAEPPPYNRRFLESRLAYRIQELAYGGLKPSTIKRLESLGEQLDGGKIAVRKKRADDRPISGTRLIREWNGRTIAVLVRDDGFVWEDRQYTSLSQIAREVTGTQWSGPRFFGLSRNG